MANTFEERDDFKRITISNNLIKLLKSEIEISPVVIDGAWGSGKSEFCRKFASQVTKETDFNVIYIDAFKYDHSSDPLVMLITEISRLLKPDETRQNNFIKSAIPILKVLSKTVIKAGVAHVLKVDSEELSEAMTGAVVDGAGDLSDESVELFLKNQEEIDDRINEFKKVLVDLCQEKNILIIIDELDRCRPSFALETLEKTKHLFDIENIDFIFSTNIKQIEAMVKKQYGHDIQAEFYLAKFFKYIIKLPHETTPDRYHYVHNAFEYFTSLVNANKDFDNLIAGDNTYTKMMRRLFEKHSISLRDSEKLIQNLEIYNFLRGSRPFARANATESGTFFIHSQIYMLGVFIYTFDSSLTDEFLHDSLRESTVNNFFKMLPRDLGLQEPYSGRDGHEFYAMLLLECERKEIFNPENYPLEKDYKTYLDNMLRESPIAAGTRKKHFKAIIRILQLKD